MGKFSVDIKEEDVLNADKKKRMQGLYDELDEIEFEYASKGDYEPLPEVEVSKDLDIDKMEFEEKSKDTLKEEIERELNSAFKEKYDKLESKNQGKTDILEDKKQRVQKDADEDKEVVDRQIEQKKQSANDDAVRSGLVRSSIIMNQLGELEKLREENKLGIDKDAIDNIKSIQVQIDGLSNELTAAKESFDENLQAETEIKLLDKMKEQEKKFQDVLKFNNSVEKQQADQLQRWQKAVFERERLENDRKKNYAEYQTEIAGAEKAKKMINAAIKYLDGMPPKDALNLVENDGALKEKLGAYYVILRQHLKGKM